MGNNSSTQQPLQSIETLMFGNQQSSYQIYQHPNCPIIKNLSHGGKLSLFKKKSLNLNQRNNKEKSLILLNHQIIFKPKSLPEIDNFKAIIAYYNKRIQFHSLSQHQNTEDQSNLVGLLHFSIKNQTTNEIIYPQNNHSSKQQTNKANKTNLPTCGFSKIFNQDQNKPSISQIKRNMYSLSFLQQFYEESLEDEIQFRASNGEYFREKQIWSIIYCCCKASQKMILNGLKEPILSPGGIFITENCEIKIGQWQFISYYFPSEQSHKNSIFQEQGQTLVTNDLEMTLNRSKNTDSQDILTKFYWPLQGLVQIQNILKLGELQNNNQKLSEAKNSQVFCLAMTILQMLTLKPYYQKPTYSQKQLNKLIEQAVQIRQAYEPMSQQMVDLLVQMLQWDPSQRFRFQDIIEYIHQVFETNQDIFKESVNFEGKSSRTIKDSDMNNNKTQRRDTRSLVTEISTDPFFIRAQQSVSNEITHRQEGFIKNINFTVSLEHSQEIKQNDLLILGDHEYEQKKDCLLDSGLIHQGMGDDYNPDFSDEEQDRQNFYEKRRDHNFVVILGKESLLPIHPDLPDLVQLRNYMLQEGEQNQNPDQDIDYEPGQASQILSQNHLLYSKQFPQKPFTMIQNVSQFEKFQVNHYVPTDWKQQDSRYLGDQKNPFLNESLNSMRSFDLKFLNQSNEDYNMKKNMKISQSPQISIKPLQLQNFSSIIKEVTSPTPYTEAQKKQHQICSPYQNQNNNLYTSPNIMEIIRQFTKKQSQQTPDFQNIQLPSIKPTFSETNFLPSKKLSFKDTSLSNQQGFKSFGEIFNSHDFSLPKNQAVQEKIIQSEDKQQDIARQQFSKGWYEGAKKNGVRNGYGTFYYKQGGKYSGYWYNNKMDGHGTLYYPDGRVAYQGQWQNDSLHGKGILINEKPKFLGVSYNFGSFQECQNQQYWTSYDGWFENDQKSGYGELLLSNSQKYVGQFKNDMVHGRGKFYKNDGTVFEGIWQNNNLALKF